MRIEVEGLGSVTNEDDGVLTLRFRTEEEAEAFMASLIPTVECTEMWEIGNRDSWIESGCYYD